MKEKVLGVNVDVLEKKEVLETVISWTKGGGFGLKQVVTAYSEFFVISQKDKDFHDIVNGADLVTADGVSVLAAVKYKELVDKEDSVLKKLLTGLKVGSLVIGGKIGETVTGVWLFEELCKVAGKRRYKIFLLGGWNGVAERAATMLLKRFPGIKVDCDEGERLVGSDRAKDEEVIDKINRFKPDILFVSYNPVKQEKWIASHKKVLKAKVAVGVGGTFDEFVGDLPGAPGWMANSGLKWLWRLWLQPRRLGRIFKAVVVFPWLVFKDSLD